tara:strand:- start:1797 stop:2342 length:546 start_codon:yes stop_codon:yes gene_type:complete
MRISFTGAQSTGKTTLLNICKKQYPNFVYVDEVTRRIKRERGLDINNTAENYDTTQIEIIKDHLQNIKIDDKQNKVILDRCIYDGFVYTRYLYELGKVSVRVYNYAYRIFRENRHKYDTVFYTDPEDVKLVNDGVRSTDIDFRNRIIEIYKEFNIDFEPNIVKISGTVNERWNTINKILEL